MPLARPRRALDWNALVQSSRRNLLEAARRKLPDEFLLHFPLMASEAEQRRREAVIAIADEDAWESLTFDQKNDALSPAWYEVARVNLWANKIVGTRGGAPAMVTPPGWETGGPRDSAPTGRPPGRPPLTKKEIEFLIVPGTDCYPTLKLRGLSDAQCAARFGLTADGFKRLKAKARAEGWPLPPRH